MNITVENFILEVDEKELFIIAFSIRDFLKNTASYCANHDGMDTFCLIINKK